MSTTKLFARLYVVGILLFGIGCAPAPVEISGPPPTTKSDPHAGHSHAHPDTGPNGGHLVELGNEEFHLEWLHDDESGKVTMFVLDGKIENEYPIPATTISLETKIGDNAKKYELAAVSASAETGKSARFEIVDKPLIAALKAAGRGTEASVTLTIDDKTFVGKFEHQADGHNHAH